MDRREGRQGKGSSKGEVRFAGNHPGRETSQVEDNPCHIHRGPEDQEGREGLEDRDDPSLVVGREETCWDFGSRSRQEGLEDWGRQVPAQDAIVPE